METISLPLNKLSEHKDNPRQIFEGVDELALSIKTQGIIHPLQVRSFNGGYQILSGAKRFRAAKSLGMEEIPAQVRELGDEAALEFMVNANLQTNPTALEEADAYKRLKERGYTVERMASATAQTSRYVYERLLLLNLIPPAKKLLASKKIQVGHAIVLARLKKDEQDRALEPNSGGVFQPEGMALGLDLDGVLRDDRDEKDPLAGFKTRTVRELEAWIRTHVRFPKNPKEIDQVLFPEARKTLDEATEQGAKILQVTYNHFTHPDAKDGNSERIFHQSSWKPADGSSKQAKPCEKSQVAMIVAGPEQGKALKVCVNKSCDVHWPKPKESKAEAKSRESANTNAKWLKEEAQRRADARRQQRQQNIWKAALPKIHESIVEALGKAPLSAIAEIMDRSERGLKEARKLMPKWKTAEDLLRLVAAGSVLAEANQYWYAPREFPARAKRFGLDVGPILKAAAADLGLDEPTCIVCGCTENNACKGGCAWVKLNETTNAGVCSSCKTNHADAAKDAINQVAKLTGKDVIKMMAAKRLTTFQVETTKSKSKKR